MAKAARVRRLGALDERLHLDEQWPVAFHGREHRAAWHRLCVLSEKEARGIGDLLESALAHGEHPNFIHRAESVLQRAACETRFPTRPRSRAPRRPCARAPWGRRVCRSRPHAEWPPPSHSAVHALPRACSTPGTPSTAHSTSDATRAFAAAVDGLRLGQPHRSLLPGRGARYERQRRAQIRAVGTVLLGAARCLRTRRTPMRSAR